MDVVSIIIEAVLCLFSIFLIAVVLLQSGKSAGLGSIGGGAESIVGKQKARGMDALMAKLTKIVAVVFMVLAVGLVLLQRFWV